MRGPSLEAGSGFGPRWRGHRFRCGVESGRFAAAVQRAGATPAARITCTTCAARPRTDTGVVTSIAPRPAETVLGPALNPIGSTMVADAVIVARALCAAAGAAAARVSAEAAASTRAALLIVRRAEARAGPHVHVS